MVAAGPRRFFLAREFHEAIPPARRVPLIGILDVLMASSWMQPELYDGALIVDEPRRSIAEYCGKSVSTIRRFEAELEGYGVLRVLSSNGSSRTLEILDPRTAFVADRAVDYCGELGRQRGPSSRHLFTGAPGTCSPVNSLGDLPLISGETTERSRLERSRIQGETSGAVAQFGHSEMEHCRQVARAIGRQAQKAMTDAAPDGAGKAWTLGRRQQSDLEQAIAKRLVSLRSGGAGTMAVSITRRDVERVVGYACKSERPAAYLYRAIARSDWRSDPMGGSQAAQVAAEGPRREMPQESAGTRSGPPAVLERRATREERERLERAMEAAGAERRHRELVARVTVAAEVLSLTLKLEAVALQQAVGS